MKQEDSFYNAQLVLNAVFMLLVVAGVLGFIGDFKTIILSFVLLILKVDLLRAEFKKIMEIFDAVKGFVENLERIEE